MDELVASLYPDIPHVMCISEHHLNYIQIQLITLDEYKRCAEYCRQSFQKGGVCMYILKKLSFTSVNLTKYCKDKDLEACAIKLKLSTTNICILTVYRSPVGNFQFFLNGLEAILKIVYKPNILLIICGDINVNYLEESKEKHELNALLNSYNLKSIIQFPTRITKNSSTAIDNIFLDITKFVHFRISPVPNGLSDHDAQMLDIYTNERIDKCSKQKVKYIRKFNEFSIQEFQVQLSKESWQNVFFTSNSDVNNIYNSFLNTYLQIFHSCFPKIKIFESQSTNKWITSGIINSCKKKKDLYLLVKSNSDKNLKNYYLRYCKILADIIKTAKKLYFKNKITHAHNKVKATWNIIKSNVGRNNNEQVIDNMDENNGECSSKINAEKFNEYFIKMSVNISEKIKNKNKLNTNNTNYSPYNLAQFYNFKYNNISLHNTSTGEILKIIKNFAWKNSQGFDEIPLKLLKVSAPFIASPLCYIINKSLSTGIFPEQNEIFNHCPTT
jgi:hypothetical protein